MNILQLFFYGNIYIALCALMLSIETSFLISGNISLAVSGIIFFGTISIYSVHRLIGLGKIQQKNYNNRFITISSHRKFLIFNAFSGGLLAFISFLHINNSSKLALILLSIPALGYVIPFLRGKRLRDFHYIKIFLIAVVWAGLTVLLPYLETHQSIDYYSFTLFSERFLFVFAITIPFDIRDSEIEKKLGVKTIPHLLGENNSKLLALFVLLVWTILSWQLFTVNISVFYSILAILSGILIIRSDSKKSDLYYTALIDGTMLLHGLGTCLILIFM